MGPWRTLELVDGPRAWTEGNCLSSRRTWLLMHGWDRARVLSRPQAVRLGVLRSLP